MSNDQLKRSVSRRQWLKYVLILFFSLFHNYSFAEITQHSPGKPNHHTINGFRNYPLVPPQAKLGGSFYWNRIKRSLKKSIVPEDHFIPEILALD